MSDSPEVLQRTPPRVWLLADPRPGNLSQSQGLLDALGWAYERKDLACGPLSVLSNRVLGARLAGYRRGASSELAPPWPDLVVACGRRTVPAARWIQQRSGGRSKLVVLGRKAGDAAHLFDLVITPEYGRGAPHANRMEIAGPLHTITPAVLDAAFEAWRAQLLTLGTAPRIALLVGGTSGQFRFDVAQARKLAARVASLVERRRGCLFFSTSRRTGAAQTRALERALGEIVVHRYDWRAVDEPNPYRGYLACADAFVITADSESMIAEACATGKPVFVFPLPTRTSYRALKLYRDWAVARAGLADGRAAPRGVLGRLALYLISRGWIRPARDMGMVQGEVDRESGFVRAIAHTGDREKSAARVRALFELERRDGFSATGSAPAAPGRPPTR